LFDVNIIMFFSWFKYRIIVDVNIIMFFGWFQYRIVKNYIKIAVITHIIRIIIVI